MKIHQAAQSLPTRLIQRSTALLNAFFMIRMLSLLAVALLLAIWAFFNMVSNTLGFSTAATVGETISIVLAILLTGVVPLAIAALLFLMATKKQKVSNRKKR